MPKNRPLFYVEPGQKAEITVDLGMRHFPSLKGPTGQEVDLHGFCWSNLEPEGGRSDPDHVAILGTIRAAYLWLTRTLPETLAGYATIEVDLIRVEGTDGQKIDAAIWEDALEREPEHPEREIIPEADLYRAGLLIFSLQRRE